jgi:hypothetical protein
MSHPLYLSGSSPTLPDFPKGLVRKIEQLIYVGLAQQTSLFQKAM